MRCVERTPRLVFGIEPRPQIFKCVLIPAKKVVPADVLDRTRALQYIGKLPFCPGEIELDAYFAQTLNYIAQSLLARGINLIDALGF